MLQGLELFDNVRCGVITESFGERCSTNSFRFQKRIPMLHAWGGSALEANITALQALLQNDTQFRTSVKRILGDPGDYLAFDVHPGRKVYAYCSGHAILTYDYTGTDESGRFLDFAYVPEPCSDIRFSSAGNYLMVTSTKSSRLFRCDPQCSTSDPFVQANPKSKYTCAVPHNTTRRWGQGNRVHCILWVDVDSFEENYLITSEDSNVFKGGVQVFGSDPKVEVMVYAAGTFSQGLYSVGMASSWVFLANADYSPSRSVVHTFPPGVQILGPPAYNSRLRRLFVPAHDHGNSSRRLIVYQIAMKPDGTVNASAFTVSGGVSEFFVQLYPGGGSSSSTALGIPVIPGFALRLDTGAISIVDETYGQVHVLLCATHETLLNNSASSSARCINPQSMVVSTSYGASAYKDVEFIGLRVTERDANPLSKPSKLFFTSLQNILQPRAELYVQCAKCYGDGVTSPDREALSNSDCFCAPGFMISAVKDVGLVCTRCQCMDGQYLDETSSRQLCDGKGLSQPGCKACYVACEEGSYMRGSCDGTQSGNPMECLPCTIQRTRDEPHAAAVCPAASTLAVRRGTQTVVYSASAFRSDCTYAKRLDCARRQAVTYPFDGNDLLEDIAPRAKRLVPVSASERSSGPTLQVFFDAPRGAPEAARPDDDLFYNILASAQHSSAGHMRTAAAYFNSSNHEYYRIPALENLFDPTLAVRVVPPSGSSNNRSLSGGEARRLQSRVEWEQGVTLCMWYKFGSEVGAWQTLFELSSGYSTEHMYVRRVSDTWDLAFGVSHSHGYYSAEHRTTEGRGVPRGAGYWNHLCWSIRHQLGSPWSGSNYSSSNSSNGSNNDSNNNNTSARSNNQSAAAVGASSYYLLPESLFVWSSVPFSFSQASSLVGAQAMADYSALWDIHINGGAATAADTEEDSLSSPSSYEGIQGVMPVEGTYSANYIGFSASFPNSFFHGSLSDLRLFERPLDRASMLAIFSGDPCCRTFVAGSYMDTSRRCSAPLMPSMRRRNSLFNSEFCRTCKSDCGPFHFIDNENNACSGTSTFDTTICKQCAPCGTDQYMNQTCSGTSFSDEASCPPCRYKTKEDCPKKGQVVIGRCEGTQIYDTSMCIDCDAQCVGVDKDPQGRGQFIERECSAGSSDYVCRPCSDRCPDKTFIFARCTGTGRTDTACSICTHFCREGQLGVPGAHGQYISGRCDGSQKSDVQRCMDCKQCPAGYYPSNLCDGISFNDTVKCTQCRTSCPAGFYLKGDCRVEEVLCVPCDPPCANQSVYLREVKACANSMNRECRSTILCKDPSCPPGFYESAPCKDPEGPKYCTPCTTCAKGQYQSKVCNNTQDRTCANCTSECPNALEHVGMVGECSTGLDTVDAVACVPAKNLVTGSPATPIEAGGMCGPNEWYSGTRAPMFVGTAAALDSVSAEEGAGTSFLPFRSDFSSRTMDTIAYLGVQGTSTNTRQTVVSVFVRNGSSPHLLLATFRPRQNYFDRLDYYGEAKGLFPEYPVAATSDWNAVDVMLSHDDRSVYVFFSLAYDFIGKCKLDRVLQALAAKRMNASLPAVSLPYAVPAAECTHLSPVTYDTAQESSDSGGSSSLVFRGCTRMFPALYIACLYDLNGAKSLLYAVSETDGSKLLVDSYDFALLQSGEEIGRPRSPPAWDPVTSKVYYLAEMSSFDGDSNTGIGLRFVAVNVSSAAEGKGWATVAALPHTDRRAAGVLWRGIQSENYNYHSMVAIKTGFPLAEDAVLVAVCMPPACPSNKALVTFKVPSQASTVYGASSFAESSHTWDVGVRWHWQQNGDDGFLYVGQQLYTLSRKDKLWGMWTHCASCPVNSFSTRGTVAQGTDSSFGTGINACKCADNFYGVLARPVVDTCKQCRILFEPDGVTVTNASLDTPCDWGNYKTNLACLTGNEDRTIDSTCAPCQKSCRPGNPNTRFAGEYISVPCDGTSFSPRIGCSVCTSTCAQDDQYMRPSIVCNGTDLYDPRPERACAPCTTRCKRGAYVANRCLRETRPAFDTATCKPCSPCSNGQVSVCIK